MFSAFSTAVSGLKNYSTWLDVISNNLANVNTAGFKAGRMTFKDIASQTLEIAANGLNPLQLGMGSSISAVNNLFTQGTLQNTGLPTDLAIQGEGFFILDKGDGTYLYTRAGAFAFDKDGNLVDTATGYQVVGLDANGDLNPISIPDEYLPGGALGPLTNFSVDAQGYINAVDANGDAVAVGQVALAWFPNPQGLAKVGDNLFAETASSGVGIADTGTDNAPGTKGRGTILGGALELSNVDLASEMSNLIMAQRAYQLNARMLTTADELMQESINLTR